mmetsp:Transcript_7521/g.21394  ORF Transcript_7521/g.21394 Transcript_7521/m.21394 type:complete len:334 (-) Transcript_7521:826-1827(-)
MVEGVVLLERCPLGRLGGNKVKAALVVLLEDGGVHDDELHVGKLLLALAADLLLAHLVGAEALRELRRDLAHLREDFFGRGIANVDEHVGVGVATADLGQSHVRVVLVFLGAKVLVDGLVLRGGLDDVVIEAEPVGPLVGPDVGVIVPPLHGTTVHKHGLEVEDRAFLLPVLVRLLVGEELGKVDDGVELEAVVHLAYNVRHEIVLKALEIERQHVGERVEPDAHARGLLSVPLRLVLVVAVQHLRGNVLAEGLVDVLTSLHVQREIVVELRPVRREVHMDALDVVDVAAAEELLDGALHGRLLHLLLQGVTQHTVEFRDVVLVVGINVVPPK